jgi:hypothetical protein
MLDALEVQKFVEAPDLDVTHPGRIMFFSMLLT